MPDEFEEWAPLGAIQKDPLGEDALEAQRKAKVQEVFDDLRRVGLLSLKEWNSVSGAWKKAEKKRTAPTIGPSFEVRMGFALPDNEASLQSVSELGDAVWAVLLSAKSAWDVRRCLPGWAEEVQSIFGTAADMNWVDTARTLGVPDAGEYDPRAGLSW
jgi:hypothetical protein